LESLYETINKNYYSDVDDDALLDGACKGLVSGLDDPYSSYMTADEYNSWKASATGEYSGVGLTFAEADDGSFTVVSVSKDSPAEKAGMKAGDILLRVDDKEFDDLELIANAIRGDEGTKVTITYSRNGKEDKVTLTRAKITQHSVEYKMLDDSTGYISISSFIESTGDDFRKALKDIEDKGAKNLVLDLRDNGGGLVDAAVEVADQFLDEGVVAYVEDKNKNRNDYDAEDGKTDLNTVVLVNENSASASEILAAALQDNGFKLVGQNTYGKGVIQSTAELSDGSAIKLTIMQYFSPDGNKIHKKGVKPDYEVKNEEDSSTDAQLEKALSLF
ncbi:MAG: S41 family peptidase, partial [Eubacteriaceae bacterium]|nr:S41 family peptidase [Eubacteriaceae bacterium]